MIDDEFEVAVIEETRAVVLAISEGESRFYVRVEGIRLWDIDISEKFSHSERLSNAAIDIGDSIDDVWKQRFQSLAAYSREVVIVDQYAMRENNINGILRLLRFLDRDARHCRVTVYSSLAPYGRGPKFTESRMGSETAKFNGNGIVSVQVHLFHESDFRKYAHDRHIRFDNRVLS